MAVAPQMLSQTILFTERMCKETKRQRSTILFGAGASIPFYDPPLTTKYLTDKVLDSGTWKRILDKHECTMRSGYNVPSASVILEVLYKIKNIYETHANGKKIDFEQLAETLDKISSIKKDSHPASNTLNLLLHMVRATPMNLPQWEHVPFLYREVIANAIMEMGKSSTYDELQEKQQNFIRAIKSSDRRVSVISLNYDDCVPKAIDGIDCFDYCFTYDPNIKCNRLDVKQFLSEPYVAYFPHGHLRFYMDYGDEVSYGNIDKAEKFRWYSVGTLGREHVNRTPFSYDFNSFITTGQTKDNAFNNPPFDTYYQRLAIDFAGSDTLYLIGYSFGDAHINRLIHGFLERDEKNKAFVIDKYDKRITMIDENKDPSNIIVKIRATLSARWDVFYGNNSSQPRPYKEVVQKGVKNVNEIGYGEIFEQVVFYRKGYESFLDEYEAVITEDYRKPRCKLIQGFIDKAKKVKAVIKQRNK